MFFKCRTVLECKTLFKRLAKKLHPDLGGEHDLMILLQEANNARIEILELEEQFAAINSAEKTKKERRQAKPKKEPKPKPEPTPWDGIYHKVTDDIFRGDPRLSIITEILNYAAKNPTFKKDFTESIQGFLDKKDYITSSQYNTLVKIYFSFRMDEKDEDIEAKDDDDEEKEFSHFS